MSTSTDGILIYGYVWPNAEGMDWRHVEIDDDGDAAEDHDFERWLQQYSKQHGVTFGTHCSHDTPMPYLAAHVIQASRGFPRAVDMAALAAQAEGFNWTGTAMQALEEVQKRNPSLMTQEYSEWGEPKLGWWLLSYWG